MIVSFLGDLHGSLPAPDAQSSLLCLCGDICPDGTLEEQRRWCEGPLRRWLAKHGLPVVAVAGDGDRIFAHDPALARGIPWTYLHDEACQVKSLKIFGIPGAPSDDDRDYNRGHKNLTKAGETLASASPIDLVLLHGAPRNFGDLIDHNSNSLNRGPESLVLALANARPKACVWAHNHSTRGCWFWRGVKMINATSSYNGSEAGYGFSGTKPYSWWSLGWGGGSFHWTGAEGATLDRVPGAYVYDRVGIGQRRIVLEENGTVSIGAAGCERQWRVRYTQRLRAQTLIISGDTRDTMHLRMDEDGCWKGRWDHSERNDVVLQPILAEDDN